MQDNSLLGSLGPAQAVAPQPGTPQPSMEQPGAVPPPMGAQPPVDVDSAMQKISEGIGDMIHGPARDKILQTFEKDSSPKAAAAILYKPAKQALDQAEQNGIEVEEDFIFGVVTDGIDMLAEILEAMGKLPADETELEEFREATLMEVMMLHAQQSGNDPEAQAMAKESLAGMAEDGTLDSTIKDVEKRAQSKGIDPNQMRAQGQQMAAPKQNPLAAGIEQGIR